MARVNMEGIAEELDRNFSKVLRAVLDEAVPGNEVDDRVLMRIFRLRIERGFERWEHVSDRFVEGAD